MILSMMGPSSIWSPLRSWNFLPRSTYRLTTRTESAWRTGRGNSLSIETQSLRRQRLAAAATFLSVVSGLLFLWSLRKGDSLHWSTSASHGRPIRRSRNCGGPSLEQAVVLQAPVEAFGIRPLRRARAVIAVGQYMLNVESLRQGDAVAVTTYMKNGVIGIIVLMVLYGTFIPNDTRTAAKVILTMALVPIVSFSLLMELEHPDLVQTLEQMRSSEHAGSNAISLLIGAGTRHLRRPHPQRSAQGSSRRPQVRTVSTRASAGAGGMGEVFMAEHQMLKRPCASS